MLFIAVNLKSVTLYNHAQTCIHNNQLITLVRPCEVGYRQVGKNKIKHHLDWNWGIFLYPSLAIHTHFSQSGWQLCSLAQPSYAYTYVHTYSRTDGLHACACAGGMSRCARRSPSPPSLTGALFCTREFTYTHAYIHVICTYTSQSSKGVYQLCRLIKLEKSLSAEFEGFLRYTCVHTTQG